MKNVRAIWAVVVLSLGACPALGVLEFKDGLTHNIDHSINDAVRVDYQTPSTCTTVNVLDGASIYWPYEFRGYEYSRINIRGGYIGNLYSHNSSQVNISGGSIGGLSIYDSSQLNISGGSISELYSLDSSRVSISGGSISYLGSGGCSQVNISGGLIHYLFSNDSSQVNISGGKINNDLRSYGSSQVNISGGLIGGNLEPSWMGRINIFGSNFAVDGQPFGYGELTSILGGWFWDEPLRYLTGTLASGEPINNGFRIGQDARIILIPEPTTIALFGLGGLVLRKRHR